jgi:hypothetical protein
LVASAICDGAFIAVAEDACKVCEAQTDPGPRQLNLVIASLSLKYKLDTEQGASPRNYPELVQHLKKSGPPSAKAIETAKRFAIAMAKWTAAGFPVRSDEEVNRLHEQVCTPCKNYQSRGDGVGRCGLCGCRLNLSRGMNKLLWATESCPDDPPRFLASVTVRKSKEI